MARRGLMAVEGSYRHRFVLPKEDFMGFRDGENLPPVREPGTRETIEPGWNSGWNEGFGCGLLASLVSLLLIYGSYMGYNMTRDMYRDRVEAAKKAEEAEQSEKDRLQKLVDDMEDIKRRLEKLEPKQAAVPPRISGDICCGSPFVQRRLIVHRSFPLFQQQVVQQHGLLQPFNTGFGCNQFVVVRRSRFGRFR